MFYKAYPRAGQDSGEAEGFGRAVLAYQFVAGLIPVLSTKVAGVEENFEQLLVKACFEEAKIRDLVSSQRGGNKATTGDASVQRRSNSYPSVGSKQGGNGLPSSIRSERLSAKSGNIRCFVCQGVGHLARSCPFKGRSAPVEARGTNQTSARSGPNRTANTTTANLQEDSAAATQSNILSKVDRLRQELKAAELEESLQKASVTTHGITQETPLNGCDDTTVQLGPKLTTEILLEGHPVQALLDTGSPVSIVSIDFLLKVLLTAASSDQTKEELKDAARKRIKPPTISVQSFGGGEVNIIGQVTVNVSQGEHSCQAVMLVQKGIQLEVLLGTDLLTKLGFLLINDNAKDLLTGLSYNLGERSDQNTRQDSGQSSSLKEAEVSSVMVTVHLLHAVKVPGRHGKMVKVQVDNIDNLEGKSMLFSPQQNKEDWSGITMASCVIGTDHLILTVENHNLHPITLPAGAVIGEIEEVEVMSPDTPSEKVCSIQPTVNYEVGNDSTGRTEKLFSILDIESSLEKEQTQALRKVIEEFTDVFALSQEELKCTELTRHVIDTEKHTPIKQLPRRTPFALRKKWRK